MNDIKIKMKKLAYIGHSYHQKTRSTAFFIDILKENYEVEVISDSSWNGGLEPDFKEIGNKKFDVIILFQMMYSIRKIRLLNCKNIILIPMFDQVASLPKIFWRQYRNINFINFSKTLHDRQSSIGINSLYVQYYCDPGRIDYVENDFTALRGFFWQRVNKLDWSILKKIIGNTSFEKFHIHGATDPTHTLKKPENEDIQKYSITISEWFEQKEDYVRKLKECNVFFASRKHEGIGMSFLEALALGKCVVAPDKPTMNEYIEHGKNGLLYNLRRPKPLDFSNAAQISKNARKRAEEGYANWNNSKMEIIDFINSSSTEIRSANSIIFESLYEIFAFFRFILKYIKNVIFPRIFLTIKRYIFTLKDIFSP